MARLSAVEGLTIYGTAPGKAGVISFALDCAHPHDIATIVDRAGVAIRAGHHCCQPLIAAARRAGDRALLVRALQHHRGDRRAGRRAGSVREIFGLMDDLRELYQEVILDHGKHPRNLRALVDRPAVPMAATRSAATS